MSGIPGIGLTNPLARAFLACAIAAENFARWWNRQPTIAPGLPVRQPFPKINHRDGQMGFKPPPARLRS